MIDSHLHVWDPGRFSYPWLAGNDELDRAFTPADLDRADGGPVVVVQADCRDEDGLGEVRWIESLATSGALTVAGIVAFAPIDRPHCREHVLDELAGSPSVVGVRRLLQDEDDELLRSDALRTGLLAVRDRGLTFDACVRWHQLRALTAALERVPGLRVVLDHIGKPPVAAGIDSDSGRAWLQALTRLSALDDVAVKLSGLPAEARDSDPWRVAPPFIDAALAAFGADRCMVGSDWPVSTGRSTISTEEWFGLVTSGLHGSELTDVLDGTASTWYGLADT